MIEITIKNLRTQTEQKIKTNYYNLVALDKENEKIRNLTEGFEVSSNDILNMINNIGESVKTQTENFKEE